MSLRMRCAMLAVALLAGCAAGPAGAEHGGATTKGRYPC